MKIWCVEDDAGIRDIELYALKSTGFEARGFEDGTGFRLGLEQDRPDLIILDVMLPGEDGVSLLKYLKSRPETGDIPVIMASARGEEYEKIQSLDLGADDYLVKPFGIMELISRVKAVLRRSAPREEGLLSVAGLVLNPSERTLKVRGERVELTYKEFELLHSLISHPGLVFTRERLMNEIWGVDYVGESRTVDMHIRSLRAKLGEEAGLIETVRNVGYRLGMKS